MFPNHPGRLRPAAALLSAALLLLSVAVASAEDNSIWKRSALTGDWAGQRTKLEDRGVSLSFVTTSEFMRNVDGGAGIGTASLDNEDLQLAIDADKLMHWKGAQFFVYGLRTFGHSPSNYAGDIQAVSNIDAPNTTKLFEAWFDQSFGEAASVRLGLYNVNSEFDVKDGAKPFLNSSHGIGKDWSQAGPNGPSIFPTTSLAARVKFSGPDGTSLMAVVADGIPGDPSNPNGTHVRFDPGDGALVAAEIGWAREASDNAGNARVGMGGWRFTSKFEHLRDVDGNGDPVVVDGNTGAYLFVEGQLWKHGPRSISAHARTGIADTRVNNIGTFACSGIAADGWVPGRPEDRLALGVAVAAHGSAGREALRNSGGDPAPETALEGTWQVRVTPWLMVQPDLQYVLNPGADKQSKAATVFGLRTVVTY